MHLFVRMVPIRRYFSNVKEPHKISHPLNPSASHRKYFSHQVAKKEMTIVKPLSVTHKNFSLSLIQQKILNHRYFNIHERVTSVRVFRWCDFFSPLFVSRAKVICHEILKTKMSAITKHTVAKGGGHQIDVFSKILWWLLHVRKKKKRRRKKGAQLSAIFHTFALMKWNVRLWKMEREIEKMEEQDRMSWEKKPVGIL